MSNPSAFLLHMWGIEFAYCFLQLGSWQFSRCREIESNAEYVSANHITAINNAFKPQLIPNFKPDIRLVLPDDHTH